jgi:hypothetical protein
LESLGTKAADLKGIEIIMSVIPSLNQLLSSITRNITGHTMKALMVRQVVWNLTEISKALLNNKISNLLTLSMLEYAMEHADEEHDEQVAWHLVNYVSGFLQKSAKVGLLHYMNVVDSAMLGLRIVEKYTKPGIHLLQSMGEAAKELKQHINYGDNKDLQLTYDEIIQRIRQVGHYGRRSCQ